MDRGFVDEACSRQLAIGMGSLRGCEAALHRVALMLDKGMPLSAQLFISLLRSCGANEYLSLARRLHGLLLLLKQKRHRFYVSLGHHLIRMFALCGSLADAKHVFACLHPSPNAHAWSALISAHTKLGQDEQAIDLFHTMVLHHSHNVQPDAPVFVAVLKACSNSHRFILGKIIHVQVAAQNLESNRHIGSCLVSIYSKYGCLNDADNVFDSLPSQNIVAWGSLISGYVLHHHGCRALYAFRQMLLCGIDPDIGILVNMLKASFNVKDAKQSRIFHSYIYEWSFESNLMVGNALVDLYSSYGSLKSAQKLFDAMPKHDIITWASMIGGYAHEGHGEQALRLYQQMMKSEGTEPNSVTFVFLIKVCSSESLIIPGRLIHNHIVQRGCVDNEHLGNALVEMHSKCGSIEDAERVFGMLPNRDLVSWNSMIAGYAKHGNYKQAKECYEQMKDKEGLIPNVITFISLLSACGLCGLVQEGCDIFNTLMDHPHFIPESDVYSCMVNILGRAGCLLEAEDLLWTVPYQRPNMITWMCLLGQCRMHGNVEMGGESFDHVVVDDDFRHASGYTLMVDMYEKAGMVHDLKGMQHLRMSANAWKRPAVARIILLAGGDAHDFSVGDVAHPQRAEICEEIKRLQVRMRKSGYVCMHVS